MTRRGTQGAVLAFASAILLTFGAPHASADIFSLTQTNTPGLCTGSCGTVTVTFNSGTIHFDVEVAPNFIFGQGGAFGFNVVGTNAGVTISNITPDFSIGSSGNMDGLGNFEFGINGPATKTDSSLQFDVTRTGNPFTGISDVEQDGSGGNPATFFAAHIANSGNTNTGFAGVNDAPCTDCQQGSVPEPTSIALLGGVLLFTATRIRRRRRVV